MARTLAARRIQTAPVEHGPSFESDFYGWAMAQASFLRAGDFGALDLPRLAEEIEDVGRSEYFGLQSALTVLIQHMLKWDHQPTKRSRSWINSIAEQRDRVEDVLRVSPSLKHRWSEAVDAAYRYGSRKASREIDIPLDTFPPDCPYDDDTLLTRTFVFAP